ncbi:MAG: dihydropteroate synthase [Micropruina sp.]|nr:dihydropteroate synthase [Micropruina sp.]
MGIVNTTPDSFSDGGAYLDPQAAIAHGCLLLEQGADIVDVGGESTRPGALRVSLDDELARVLPVIRALAAAGAVVSVDTMRAPVANAAVDAGAVIVNDVSGGLDDPAMLHAVAERGVGYIAMHWRGQSDRMQNLAVYADVVAEVRAELAARRDAALAAGIAGENLVLDPGLGFAKTAAHNWTLLAHLDALQSLGQPLLVGASRKRFLGELMTGRPPGERDDATVALTTLLARQGVWAVRTHSVRAHRDASAVVQRLGQEAVRTVQ